MNPIDLPSSYKDWATVRQEGITENINAHLSCTWICAMFNQDVSVCSTTCRYAAQLGDQPFPCVTTMLFMCSTGGGPLSTRGAHFHNILNMVGESRISSWACVTAERVSRYTSKSLVHLYMRILCVRMSRTIAASYSQPFGPRSGSALSFSKFHFWFVVQ